MTATIARALPWLALAACLTGRLVAPRWSRRGWLFKTRYGRG